MSFALPIIDESTGGGFDDWRWQLRHRITGKDEIAALMPLTDEESVGLEAAPGRFRVAVTPYYFSLIDRDNPACPVRMQVIPRARELVNEPGDLVDPLGEDSHSPATGIFHRYPDRCLLLALDRCAIYCRHCNRRRLVGREESPISRGDLDGALDYIRRTPAIRDVLISGGDPLTLSTARLEEIIKALRAIPHVEIVRIGTRVPVVLPMRIDDELCAMLKKYHPLYINTHFNHPKELTPLARAACEKLADAGIPLGNQTVLLRGVNSSVRVLRKLFTELLRCRVRPYYLFQGDVAAGTSHLRTSVETGIALMQELRGHISGLAIPHLVIDTPGGMGKVSIGPDYVVARGPDKWTLRNYEGKLVDYPQPADKDATCAYDEVYFASCGDPWRVPVPPRDGLRRAKSSAPPTRHGDLPSTTRNLSTLRDVAKRARVSPMTVSRVANGASGVRPETRRRVEKAIADLGFIPNSVARGLKSSKTGSLGLIVPDIVNPFFAVVVRGAETVARRAGYRAPALHQRERSGARAAIRRGHDLAPGRGALDRAGGRSLAGEHPAARAAKFPFVLMDRGVQGLDCDLVQGDNLAGARRLVRHLISIGHRRIAAIIEPDNVSTARERLAGVSRGAGVGGDRLRSGAGRRDFGRSERRLLGDAPDPQPAPAADGDPGDQQHDRARRDAGGARARASTCRPTSRWSASTTSSTWPCSRRS